MKTFNITARFTNNLKRLPVKVSLLMDDQLIWSKPILDTDGFDLNLNDTMRRFSVMRVRFEGKTGANDPDTHLSCDYFRIDGRDLGYILENTATFYHSYNSTGPWDQTMQYADVVGIDGELTFDFETPVAFWISKRDKW